MRRVTAHMMPFIVILVCIGQVPAADPPATGQAREGQSMVTRTLELLDQSDSAQAIDYLQSQPEPLLAMDAWQEVVMQLYWKRKDLPMAIVFARAGIQFGLAAAARVEAADKQAAAKLRSAAKAIAYNLGSFCWPGWNEPGITITATDLRIGADAARTNLRLAESLDRGNLPLSQAHWLVGAYHLARADHTAARAEFDQAAELARAAKSQEDVQLNLAYAHLAEYLAAPKDHARRQAYTQATAALAKVKEGQFFIDQVETARQVFTATTRPTR